MNLRPVDGKAALVTGAGGTAERAVVRALATNGCPVARVAIAGLQMD